MDKIKEFASKYFKISRDWLIGFLADKTVFFYALLGVCLLPIISIGFYAGALGASEFMSWLAFWLCPIGIVVMIALAVVGFPREGAAAMAIALFAGFIIAVSNAYNYYVSFAIAGGVDAVLADSSGFGFIVSAVLWLVAAMLTNACAWLPLQKKSANAEDEQVEDEDEDDPEGADEGADEGDPEGASEDTADNPAPEQQQGEE